MIGLPEHIAILHISLAVVTPPPYLRIWWILAAILVFLMQVGFMLVETGFVRQRSMSGIALKTFLMLLASSLAYSVVGYCIMYGPDVFHGLMGWGTSPNDLGMEWQFYQTGFAAVAATIISGTIAERTTLTINVFIAFIIGAFVYPIVGHWVWASDGWLHLEGFHDLAGSGAVHFLGGISAAAAAWITGPRLDKYDPVTRKVNEYVGERSLPLVSCGVIFLWLGWMGFNGGSVRDAEELTHAGFYIIATCCAASAGGFAIMLLSPLCDFLAKYKRTKRGTPGELGNSFKEFLQRGELVRPFDILPATMGGMVAITANSDLLLRHSYLMALPIGICGGVAAFVTSNVLRSKYIFLRLGKIDDPAEAIPVHAGAGAAGILIAACLSSRIVPVRFVVQVVGLAAIGVFTFAAVAAVFYALNGRTPDQAPRTRIVYYAEPFGPKVSPRPYSTGEVLGKVHYLFDINYVRSTMLEEDVGLRFEPKSVRTASFPLRTAFVAQDLQKDIQDFLSALVSPPIHNLGSLIERVVKSQDFVSPTKSEEIKGALLIEIKRMESLGALKVDEEPVLFRSMVNAAYREFAMFYDFFQSNYTGGQGDEQDEFKVYAQKEMIENAVRALFSNAVRAVRRRAAGTELGYTPMVRCELRRDPHRVVLSVVDNGGGVPSAVRDRLFEPFNKGPEDGGHGLALFYAAWVAEAFGGRLVLQPGDLETRFDLILQAFEEIE